MLNRWVIILLCCFNLTALPSAFAQQSAPPYENQLLRLSEVIGSVHFLSLLCKPDDGLIWHEQMQEMLDAEATTELRRAKLVERFNTGFSGFQATYRKCTSSAEIALNRYIGEAQNIVQNLTDEYTNPE